MENSNWISSKEAAQKLGYAPEYVAHLCRTGQLVSKREGSGWSIQEGSVETFKKASLEVKERFRPELFDL